MQPTVRRTWANALRSGKYPQGRGELHSHGRYCAMGVLFALVAPEDQKLTELWGAYLPNEMLDSVGLSNDAQLCVARLNDSGVSFQEIADLVDRDADLDETLAQAVAQELKRIGQQLKKVPFPSAPYFNTVKYTSVKSFAFIAMA